MQIMMMVGICIELGMMVVMMVVKVILHAREYDDDDDDDDVDDGDGDVDGMCLQTAREKTGTDQKLQHNAALCRSWSVASSG